MTNKSWDSAKKAYLTSLRAKLKKAYAAEVANGSNQDRRWLNGFMAAGFHAGLVSLSELKVELMTAYRKIFGAPMPQSQQVRLERRLTGLCKQ